MKYRITGADRQSGAEHVCTIEAEHETTALILAKQQGVFPYKVELLPSNLAVNQSVEFTPISSSENNSSPDASNVKNARSLTKGTPNRFVIYAIAALFALGIVGMVGFTIDHKSGGSTRQPTNSSDERNADLLIAGIAFLGGNGAVRSVTANGNTATITVENAWHFSPYQVRLQAAQNIWKFWSKFAPTKNADEARISIVDLNGNEVGGSRILGGSLIWVQQN